MWHPSRGQWGVIWAGFILAALLWTDGLDVEYETDRVATVVVIGAGLLVWRLSRRKAGG